MGTISIIIPTYNRSASLRAVLPSYTAQAEVLELIVINDHSSMEYTDTVAFARELCARRGIELVYLENEKNLGAAACRNLGVARARGEFILWGEDDAFLRADYTEVLLAKCRAADRRIYFGSIYYGIRPDDSDERIEHIKQEAWASGGQVFDYERFLVDYQKRVNADMEVPFGHALLLVPRAAYEGVQYAEDYAVNGFREETDAQVKLTEKGYSICFTSDTECYHFPPAADKGGQHGAGYLRFQLYTILNNNKFWDRYYAFFRKRYGLKHTKGWYKRRYVIGKFIK